MEIKEQIQDFTLKGIDGEGEEKTFSFSDFKDGTVILYFYPKDDTPYCTVEACDFRDNFNRLTGKARVIGISTDSVESHKKFQKKHSLNFILLSDPDHSIAEMFGAWMEDYKGLNRSTFLIKNGVLEKKWHNVNVKGHIDEVIASI